jgi:hypothetical protein
MFAKNGEVTGLDEMKHHISHVPPKKISLIFTILAFDWN